MGYGSILNQSFETSPVLDNYFTKNETLTSNTAALYGLSRSAVPDDVLEKARSLITTAQNTANSASTSAGNSLKVATGSYTGTQSGYDPGSKTIRVSGTPYVLFLWAAYVSPNQYVKGNIPVSVFIKGQTKQAMMTVDNTDRVIVQNVNVTFNAASIVISDDDGNYINNELLKYAYVVFML